jgi:hypothetical protein
MTVLGIRSMARHIRTLEQNLLHSSAHVDTLEMQEALADLKQAVDGIRSTLWVRAKNYQQHEAIPTPACVEIVRMNRVVEMFRSTRTRVTRLPS